MVNIPETYDLMFDRLKTELTGEEGRNVRHLVILLGVPIAYPRFLWLENIIKSPLMGTVRFLNRDDLDDHYCAHPHKLERNAFILRLQEFSCTHDIRITILSGDVHLAAVGRFYSNPKLNIPTSSPPIITWKSFWAWTRRTSFHRAEPEKEASLMPTEKWGVYIT
ncbi:hypothetical protein RUND412_011084 [Rhizina undulata]